MLISTINFGIKLYENLKNSYLISIFLMLWVSSLALSDAKQLLKNAEYLYSNGNYPLALNLYQEIHKKFPYYFSTSEVICRIVEVEVRLARYREAIVVFDRNKIKYSNNKCFDSMLYWSGIAFYELGKYKNSALNFSKLLLTSKRLELFPQTYLYHALSEIATGGVDDAIVSLQELVQYPQEIDSVGYGLVTLGHIYIKENRWEDIRLLYKNRSFFNFNIDWRLHVTFYLAEANWQLGDLKQAEKGFSFILSQPNATKEMIDLSLKRSFSIAQNKRNLDLMKSLAVRAENIFPDKSNDLVNYWLRLGIQYYAEGRINDSRYYFRRIYNNQNSGSAGDTSSLYLAEIEFDLLEQGSIQKSFEILSDQFNRSEEKPWSLLLKSGDLHMLNGNFKESSSFYQRVINALSDVSQDSKVQDIISETYFLLSYSLYRQGEIELSLNKLKIAQELGEYESLSSPVLRLHAVILSEMGKIEEVNTLIELYSEKFLRNYSNYIDYMRLLYSIKKWEKIIDITFRLFQEFPDLLDLDHRSYVISLYLSGLSYGALGNPVMMEKSLAKINLDLISNLGLSEILPYVQYYLAESYYWQGKYSKAFELLSSIEETFNDHELETKSRILAGKSSFSLGNYFKAAEIFRFVASNDFEYTPLAKMFLGRSLANMEELEEAVSVFESLVDSYPNSKFSKDALYEIAGILILNGKNIEAVQIYDTLLEDYPQSNLAEDILYRKAEILFEDGYFSEAKQAFSSYRISYPNGKFRPEALYWGAWATREMGEPIRAAFLWELLIKDFKQSPLRPDAFLQAAESYIAEGNYKSSLNLLEKLAVAYSNEAIGKEALLRMRKVRLLIKDSE